MRKPFIFIFCLIPFYSFGQGELFDQGKIFYRDESSFCILINTIGFTTNYRYAKHIDAFKKSFYDFDFSIVKHPKETKSSYSQYSLIGGNFIYGKENQFYNFRLGYGLQNEIFKKADQGGISIRRYFSFGPVIGLLKPIYYQIEVIEDPDNVRPIIKSEKFNTHIPPTSILGRDSYFKGFDEIKVIPGIYGKFGMMFEFSKYNEKINAVEIGLTFDVYLKEATIMATEDNKQFFISLYAGYRFGKIIDSRFKNHRKNKIDDILIK